MRFLAGIFCLFIMTCAYAIDDSGDDGMPIDELPILVHSIDMPEPDED